MYHKNRMTYDIVQNNKNGESMMYDLWFIIGWCILGIFGVSGHANSFRLFIFSGISVSIGIPILIFLYSNMNSAVDNFTVVIQNYFTLIWESMIVTAIGFCIGSIIFFLLKWIKNR